MTEASTASSPLASTSCRRIPSREAKLGAGDSLPAVENLLRVGGGDSFNVEIVDHH
jgi:hypothetical protein